MDQNNKFPKEPAPETGHFKKHKKEEEFFLKESEEKIKKLKEKLKTEQEKKAPEPKKEPESSSLSLMLEPILLLALVLALTRILLWVKAGIIAEYSDLIIAGLWLYSPILLVWIRKIESSDLALEKINFWKSLKWFFITGLLILPIFYLFTGIGALKILGYKFNLQAPDNLLNLVFTQLLIVALPEEWFFRGYVQARFNQALGKEKILFRASIGWGWILSAGLFALAHFFIWLKPESLLVFFPALVFGWLREKTDSLLAPILFHFSANLTFIIFQLSIYK